MSRGAFLLAPGDHSLSIIWDQKAPGGNSTLQWFEVAAAPARQALITVTNGTDSATLNVIQNAVERV